MNCQEFDLIVIALAREQVPDVTVRAQSHVHLERCVPCMARLSEERALLVGIQAVVSELTSEEAPAHLEATLLAALHAQAERHKTTKSSPVMTRWMSWKFATAVAALLLVVILAGVAWRQFKGKEQKQEVKQLPTPSVSPRPQVASNDRDSNTRELKQMRATIHRAPPRRSVRQSVTQPREDAPLFYSLVAEGEMAPLESGRIIRIEVPTSTLVNLGVPLTEATLAQPMQADLLLGQDGLARAIRFLPYPQTTKTQ